MVRPDLDTVATALAVLAFALSGGAFVLAYRARRLTVPARLRELEREGRELVQELTDSLDKLNTMALRLAKRESRSVKRVLSEETAEPQGPQLHVDTPPPADRIAWKTQVRARNGW